MKASLSLSSFFLLNQRARSEVIELCLTVITVKLIHENSSANYMWSSLGMCLPMLLDLVIMECAMDDMTVMIFYFFCAVGTRDIIQSRPLCCHLCASIQVFIRAQCSLV